MKIACLEEVAFRMGYISLDALVGLTASIGESAYKDYLRSIASDYGAVIP
jgi:glucose-1-phosphate thymidylyltransferase